MKTAIPITIFILLSCAVFSVQGEETTETEISRPAVTPLRKLQLPEPKLTGILSVEEALAARRSIRQFTKEELDLEQVAQLAWAGQGITQKETGYRTAPSAGAIYPIRLYFIIKGGMYVYEPGTHSLEKLINRDLRNAISQAALRQQSLAKAACNILIAGSVKKVAAKYGLRARQYMLLEAGHIAQNIHLQAVSLGLGSVPIGAFEDRKVEKICGLPSEEQAIYLLAVGHPAGVVPTHRKKVDKRQIPAQSKNLEAKKTLLIIAEEEFQDQEFFDIQDILDIAGIQTTVASWQLGILTGEMEGKIEATVLVNDVNVDDYDAIVIIGSSELKKHSEDEAVLDMVRQVVKKQKILAAIDEGPRILAEAGVLRGVIATCVRSQRRQLLKAQAKYTGGSVEQDGLIITADGQKSTSQFSRTLIGAMLGIGPKPRDEQDIGRYVHRKIKERREKYQTQTPEEK